MHYLILIVFCLVGCSQKIPIQEEKTPPIVYTAPTRPAPLIVVDPGHGGEDQGTLSILKPKYQEKSFTLATAKLLKGYLETMGYRVLMTRIEDIFVSLIDRAQIANAAKSALFISVHYNSAPSQEANGIEVFYYQEENARSKASKELATRVLNQLILLTNAKSRGVKTANFAVTRETNMPAILIEGGFLTNEKELQKIKDPEYLKQIAWAIAKGIDSYLLTLRNRGLDE